MDEYIGLSGAFLYAGAISVVCTLWAVDDMSTGLLMEHFYQQFVRDEAGNEAPADIAVSLDQAQRWMRRVTAAELGARFGDEMTRSAAERSLPTELVSTAWRRFAAMSPNVQPFAHPFYWAAFAVNGSR
jgi:CHAT domain-containing protein